MQTFCYTRHQTTETLIDFLVRRFPYQGRDNWDRCIKDGQIRVNDLIVSPLMELRSKDIISYQRSRESEPEVDDTFKILHEDDAIIVVEKSGNIPISESGRYYKNTLIHILMEKQGYKELFAVHRLDKETSGVLVIARQKNIATILGKQFVAQIPKKTYHAVLRGEMTRDREVIDRPIRKGKTSETTVRIRQIIAEDGKPSKTEFDKVRVGGGLTLSEIRTYSGRTHQIRCHAEFMGYPLLGDKLYGQEDDYFIAIQGEGKPPEFIPWGIIDRQLLHASSLSFRHPVSEDWLTFTSDYVPVFSAIEATRPLFGMSE